MEQRIIIEEKPFPEDLEERLSAILNVVNTEYKSLTTLFGLDTEHFYDEGQIMRRVIREIGSPAFLPKNALSFRGYCDNSLYPIGTVAKQIIISEGEVTLNPAYKLTEAGFFYGQPIAAFSLFWAYNNHKSLYEILGQTSSTGKTRAPYSRVRILESLRNKNLREADLFKILGEESFHSHGALRRHLTNLKKEGLVNFDSVGTSHGRGIYFYELTNPNAEFDREVYLRVMNEKKPDRMKYPILASKVFYALKEIGASECNELSEKLKFNKIEISVILSNFETLGIARRLGKWRPGEIHSDISLTDNGRKFLDEYVEPLRDALSERERLNKMSLEYLDKLVNDEAERMKVCQGAAKLYYEISPFINSKERTKRFEEILELAKEGKITSKLVSERFELSRQSALILLLQMERAGMLVSEVNENREKVYTVKS